MSVRQTVNGGSECSPPVLKDKSDEVLLGDLSEFQVTIMEPSQ
jgi:hypothetical protein